MRIRNRWVAVLLTAAMSLSVCACAEEKKEPTFTGEKTKEAEYQDYLNMISPAVYGNVQGLALEPGTYISIIGKSESAAYWKMLEKGVMQAAEDLNAALGYTGDDKIKVTYNAPADDENIDEQVNILDEELARYPDVVGIASVDEDACMVQFDLATTNGIPIISLDSGNTYKGIQCVVKTDNEDAARTGAYKLADEIQEGSVLLLVQDSQSEAAREREESFVAQMKKEGTVNVAKVIYLDQLEQVKEEIIADKSEAEETTGDAVVEIVGETDASATEQVPSENAVEKAETDSTALEEETEKGQEQQEEQVYTEISQISDEEAIQYYMKKYEIKGIFGTNPEATQLGLKAIEALENVDEETEGQEDEIVLMGFDAGTDQITALKEGKIKGLVVQNPFGIGYASVIAAARTDLEIGNEAVVHTGYVWVTANNMEEESIQKMLYE